MEPVALAGWAGQQAQGSTSLYLPSVPALGATSLCLPSVSALGPTSLYLPSVRVRDMHQQAWLSGKNRDQTRILMSAQHELN